MFGFLDDAIDDAKEFFTPKKMKETASDAVSSANTWIEDVGNGFADEGIGALLDPVGMMDRQNAKKELAPYFGIVDEDFEGHRNHDQVTQAQFDEIARTYSDIRLGRGDLTINTDKFTDDDAADAYREDVMGDIAKLMRTTSGREQIDFLSDNPDDVKTSIRAYVKKDGKTTTPDASFEAWGPNDNRIYFADPGAKPEIPDNANHLMLAHEMEHARQRITGTQPEGDYGVPGDDYFTENSERAAVGLAHSDASHPADKTAATENRIRWELNQIGEEWLPRTNYDVSWAPVPGEERNDKKRNRAWREFLTSPDHPGFE